MAENEKKKKDKEQLSEEEISAREEQSAARNAAINARYSRLIEEYEPKNVRAKRAAGNIVFFVLLLLAAAVLAAVVWFTQTSDRFKTGIMEDGSFCIACVTKGKSAEGEFFLPEDAPLTEVSRFAFSKIGGRVKHGRIYLPTAEGSTSIYVSHAGKTGSPRIFERYDVNVDSGLSVTYTAEVITEEEYRKAAGLPDKEENDDNDDHGKKDAAGN